MISEMVIYNMILALDLEDNEIDEFNLYTAIEYLWTQRELFNVYKNLDGFKKDYKSHITDLDGNNYVCVIDTAEEHFEIVNIIINTRVSGLEND